MKVFLASTALAAVLFGAVAPASADSYRHDDWNQRSNWNQHSNWKSQSDWRPHGHVAYNDWNRGQQVDWRAHHLRRPPAGYEWRNVDGRYVMAAVATGVIAAIILSNR